MSKDSLGDRMKEWYEDRTRYYLPRRTYTIMRLDGKSFHTWTKGLDRPFDYSFASLMDASTKELCKQIQGTVLGYVQSDEISLLLRDFDPTGDRPNVEAWFDGNIQKMCSIGASTLTAIFNSLKDQYLPGKPFAMFDCRVFTIPNKLEVFNYFVWRQNDAIRNSISLAAQSVFSHKELHGKNSNEMQEMLFSQHGINWNDYHTRFKRGALFFYDQTEIEHTKTLSKTGKELTYTRPTGWSIVPDLEKFTSTEEKIRLLSLI